MLRRIRMVLPLFFAFVLTLLPFMLLEFTQNQRNEIRQDRDLYLWEQKAHNYLQLLTSLWSYELQLKRRMVVFRKNQGEAILKSPDPELAFEQQLKKRFPTDWLPEVVYAGRLDKKSSKFKLFRGNFFSNKRRKIFETIISSLLQKSKDISKSELKRLDRFSEGAMGTDLTFGLLKNFRRGRICFAKINGKNRLLCWDFFEDDKARIAYFCFFKPELITAEKSIKMVSKILSKEFPGVFSVLVPVEEADKKLLPMFDLRISDSQRKIVNSLIRKSALPNSSRAEILPIGSMVKIDGQNIIREFVDFQIPYEVWLLKAGIKEDFGKTDIFIFTLRLIFFSIWFLVFIKVFITARPLGISIENWLTMIFVLIGVVPLIVLNIAGTFHLESSAFRQEQQAVKETIRMFEETDLSGEAILSEYREFCRSLEMSDSWRKAMLQWNPEVWKAEIAKLPDLFAQTGLKLSACYIYPPPVSNLKFFQTSFTKESSDRDQALASFYESWVGKSYFALDPSLTNNQDYSMTFFEGEEGDEILRLFMGNRADSDIADLGYEKQFFYQNYVLENGLPKNWYFFRANILDNFERYLHTKVTDWNETHQERFFSLARIKYPEPEILLPEKKWEDKRRGVIKKHAGSLINLAADTAARIFKQSQDNFVVVYPCRKSGNFILAAVITFRNLHKSVYDRELLLAIILLLLCFPVIITSRFISGYLVHPLKEIEEGLRKVADEDFSSRLHLNRQDELGDLSDAFDLMVDGIKERRNLGRFVSAGLDVKIAQEEYISGNQLEKSYGAVLCSDIRSFTSLSEKHSVREIVVMLNEHLTSMSASINSNGGLVEQFIGDAILAVFFGETEKEAVKKALLASVDMVEKHRSLIEKRRETDSFDYDIGVGIEVGNLLSGVLKAGNKNEYVLLGQPRMQSEVLEGKSKLGKHSKIVCSKKVKDLSEGFDFDLLSDNENWEMIFPESKS